MKFYQFTALHVLPFVEALYNPSFQSHPYVYGGRQLMQGFSSSNQLELDLGYSVYGGFHNSTSNLNSWLGLRFASPPTGTLRWQAPRPPASNRSSTIPADAFAPLCPQTNTSPSITGIPGDEDCLFLNVWAPPDAQSLPVYVWIHGGGYGQANEAQADLANLVNSCGRRFVAVEVNYRLGAFGFLSSEDIRRSGALNAGLLDIQMALQWIQTYITLFGGSAQNVTIHGQSAGGGAVMLMNTAYGGTMGTTLYRNIRAPTFVSIDIPPAQNPRSILSSPYLPMQHNYSDTLPTARYNTFAANAGCATAPDIFQCLVQKPTEVLQQADFQSSGSIPYGQWAFYPVTDGTLVQDRPSQMLLDKKVNGQKVLVGNNANEGSAFVPPNITTVPALNSYLTTLLPLFRPDDISELLNQYPIAPIVKYPNQTVPRFATSGNSGPTALNTSSVASGQQQRADNIYAETTFVCPSYWVAEAYSDDPDPDKAAYKYQFSVPVATHGRDNDVLFDPVQAPNFAPDFTAAFRNIIGNFVVNGDPSIPLDMAAGSMQSNPNPSLFSAVTNWTRFSESAPYQVNINQTGGVPYRATGIFGTTGPVSQLRGPGLKNNFSLVDAFAWEGGRGARCDYWRNVSSLVPE